MTDRNKPEIFSCEDIDWSKLELLFEGMSRRKPGKEKSPELSCVTLLDLPVVSAHVPQCSSCRERLLNLAKKHGITFSRLE